MNPALARAVRDVGPAETDGTRAWAQLAGDQIDERGLAGAIGTDERVACARCQNQPDVARDLERAEALMQSTDLECRLDHGSPPWRKRRAKPSKATNSPFGAKRTGRINSPPPPNHPFYRSTPPPPPPPTTNHTTP